MKTLLALFVAALSIAAAPPPREDLTGVWRNPKGTVEVRIDACATGLCGTVVAASPSAIANARDSGYPELVGMRIMQDYHEAGRARWQGSIFVPDMGRSFASHIELVDADHVRVSGCVLGQWLCKSQLWRRA